MGSGEIASAKSIAAIKLTKAFYECGLEDTDILYAVNKLLPFCGNNDVFSTIDFCRFDCFTGDMFFSKVGAPQSFIYHNSQVIKIGSGALPAGIIEECTPEHFCCRLSKGALVVMLTDGISDAIGDLLCSILPSLSDLSPQESANAIIKKAASASDRADDMTVIILKVT